MIAYGRPTRTHENLNNITQTKQNDLLSQVTTDKDLFSTHWLSMSNSKFNYLTSLPFSPSGHVAAVFSGFLLELCPRVNELLIQAR